MNDKQKLTLALGIFPEKYIRRGERFTRTSFLGHSYWYVPEEGVKNHDYLNFVKRSHSMPIDILIKEIKDGAIKLDE